MSEFLCKFAAQLCARVRARQNDPDEETRLQTLALSPAAGE